MKPVEVIAEQNRAIRRIERGRLFRKYLLLILALVCGALLISGAIGLYFSYQENSVALSSVQREKALGAAARIEDFIRQIELQLTYTVQAQLSSEDVGQLSMEFFRLQKNLPAITDVALIDADGRERIAVSRLGMNRIDSGVDRSAEPAFKGARSDQTWFGPVYFRKETEPYLSLSVRSPSGKVTVADVNLKFMWDVVSRIKIGKKGKAYVVDGAGQLVAHPDIGIVLRKTNLAKLPQVEFALRGKAEDSLALRAQDISGGAVLTAYATIETLGWKVFVEQPIAEVYETLNAAILRTVSLLIAGLLFSALAAMWLARSMVRPIRTLQEGAARIGAGDLEQKIEVKTGDELQALAEQFNRMSAQLRESYAELEKKVEQRTAELQKALERQTATAEILRVISGSPTDTQPVFDAIAERAERLCEGGSAVVYLREGEMIRRVAVHGPLVFQVPGITLPVARESVSGRAVSDGATIHVHDISQEREQFPQTWELVHKHAHGSDFPTSHTMLAVPLLKDQAPIGVIMVRRGEVRPFSDQQITLLQIFADQAVIAIENVRLFHEIEEKSHQLEIANKHKSDFLANMSHELRTPLNAIIGFSEVLIEKMFGEVNEKQLDYLKDIHSSGRHLLSLINDILDLSKIEAGRMELDVAEFDLRSALQNAITLVKERAQRHGVALSLVVDDSLGALRADERKFKQIMLNLLSNAVKFTPEGGKVSVAARPNGAAVEFSVADTGVGIAPEDQQLVFEEFRQVGRDYTRKSEGTGLGLALTKRFVELHGGEIRLESAPGKGSTFTFTIPLRP